MNIQFRYAKHEDLLDPNSKPELLDKWCDKWSRKHTPIIICGDDIRDTLNVLAAAASCAELPESFHPHPLHFDRDGQFAVWLNKNKRARLTFVPLSDYTDGNRKTITDIEVLEICTDYHKN